MTPHLQSAIASVYSAFSDATRPNVVDACDCCVSDDEALILVSKPLRELTPDDLSSYAATVFVTAGSAEDFFYFIPRILEILAVQRIWRPSPEIVTTALYKSGFHDWPTARKNAVLHYFDEILNDLLSTEDSGFEIDAWICGFGRLQLTLYIYLSRISDFPDRFKEFYEVNLDQIERHRLANSFWDDAPDAHDSVVRWLVDTAKIINGSEQDAAANP